MLLRNPKARYLHILGWILLCVSPFTMDAYRNSSETIYVELGFNIFIGIVIMFYLLLNSDVKNYFSSTSSWFKYFGSEEKLFSSNLNTLKPPAIIRKYRVIDNVIFPNCDYVTITWVIHAFKLLYSKVKKASYKTP